MFAAHRADIPSIFLIFLRGGSVRALSLLFAVVSLPVYAAGLLNDTGVTQCYDGSGLVACDNADTGENAAYPRQDARFGRDAAGHLLTKSGGGAAGFDFTPLDAAGNAIPLDASGHPSATPSCVRDSVTDLVWEVKTDDGGLRDMDWYYTWYTYIWYRGSTGALGSDTCGGTLSGYSNHCNTNNYVAAVNAAGLCGFDSGWRLPSRSELVSIVDNGANNPAIDANFFYHTGSGWYWTGDLYAADPTEAWTVSFRDGYVDYTDDQSVMAHLRLVHGGSAQSAFVDNGDGTVTDTVTGLMWDKCNWGLTGNDCSGDSIGFYGWQGALVAAVAANEENYKGHNDWRLPNKNELESLAKIDASSPAIDASVFPNAFSHETWSSTIYSSDPSYAWLVQFDDGSAVPNVLNVEAPIRLVRGGQSFTAFDSLQPEDGLWIVDAENNGGNGRGFQLESRDGVLVMTYYGYLAGGADYWYLTTGPFSNGNFTGVMEQYRGGTSLGGAYQAASDDGSVGMVSLSFDSPTSGTVSFPGEAPRAIEKFVFSGNGSPVIAPENGLWIIDAENNGNSGRGFQIEQHGGEVVFTYYGYESGGQETWYLASGSMNGNTFTGTLNEFRGGTPLGGSYSAATTNGSPGQVMLTFTSSTAGIIQLPGESARAISKFSW